MPELPRDAIPTITRLRDRRYLVSVPRYRAEAIARDVRYVMVLRRDKAFDIRLGPLYDTHTTMGWVKIGNRWGTAWYDHANAIAAQRVMLALMIKYKAYDDGC